MKTKLLLALIPVALLACSRDIVIEEVSSASSTGTGGSEDAIPPPVFRGTGAATTTATSTSSSTSTGADTCSADADCVPPPCMLGYCEKLGAKPKACLFVQNTEDPPCTLPGGTAGKCSLGICEPAAA